MRRKAVVVLVLCIAVLTMLTIAASPAAAGAGGQPQLGTPGVAYFHIYDGNWWWGGNGWGDTTEYAPGTPIPAQYFITLWDEVPNPDRSLVEQMPQTIVQTLTVRAPNGGVVLRVTEDQSAQYWTKVVWDPSGQLGVPPTWARHWLVPLGYLSPGTYHITYVFQLPTTVVFTDPATGELIFLGPLREITRLSLTVQ